MKKYYIGRMLRVVKARKDFGQNRELIFLESVSKGQLYIKKRYPLPLTFDKKVIAA